MSIRVMMVDDHPVVRAGLRALLEADARVEVVAEVDSGDGALEELERLSTLGGDLPDLVLMDLNLGAGIDGIETTRKVRARHPDVQVLAVTTFDAEADIVGALEAGATGYVLKDSPTEALIAAVGEAAAGRSVLSPEVQQRLVARMTSPATALSPREAEILEALATGATNREVAKRLFISESTVKTHLVHLYEKLGVDSRTAALRVARERRLIR
ncbi:response regulator containing a CheY-like receiver domain and an HTH DNA-binding domain [Brachybacterium faecium DSM 4810]|uniref:Response regulator containing a CheY-like receiver domain and an HTH DNA-binding domain n=1 Tax=Brachybacterium faecium (strain ATCC 43885 / DSM 4810 / JCM 11609 / LMG 19847 / NBRC 14762 / NCIMB 9860 / 6-10) TaxID=446465 RepID=C7MF15_BRAFD|nr:response regulator transcription factor [Brachybacterium faecium]ACU83915.1 response regulator containing a CheY-like receiver domain and an HTH DNA-binding domain [Brachybacterium faecium DSM 4810]